jgi:hypothetical protein
MRFENISNDLKCILSERYGFLFLKSPIHVYQYGPAVPGGSAILSLNLTQECILSLCPLYLTLLWTLLQCIYIESGPHRPHRQLFHNCAMGLLTRPRVLRLT